MPRLYQLDSKNNYVYETDSILIYHLLALCTACSSPKGSDTVQVAETTTEQTIQKASSAIHYNAFSHNDYWRERPLLDALSFRFNCVEADLWLIDGELYVSHDRPEPNPAITFENLYLKPLVARIQANGGKVYPGSDRPFYLMVDCKAQGEEMYKLLKKQMEPYKEYFCSVDNGEYKEGAVSSSFPATVRRTACRKRTAASPSSTDK